MERVELATQQNAHLLPLTETLLRGSVAPTDMQAAELLHSAQQGCATSGEELLRASKIVNAMLPER